MKKPSAVGMIVIFIIFAFIQLFIAFILGNAWFNNFSGRVYNILLNGTVVVVIALIGTYFVYKKAMNLYNADVKEQIRLKEIEQSRIIAEREEKEIAERKHLHLIRKNFEARGHFQNNFQLAEIKEFSDLLLNNQSKIDKDYIFNLVKLHEYLNTKRNSIEKQRKLIKNLDFNNEIDASIEPEIELIFRQNDYLKSLTILSIKMINALLTGNLVLFYSIFNQFDRLGIFNKEWENQLLELMGEINSNLLNVIDEIGILEASVSSSIYDLQLEIISKE